jgi:hypothetical protein
MILMETMTGNEVFKRPSPTQASFSELQSAPFPEKGRKDENVD